MWTSRPAEVADPVVMSRVIVTSLLADMRASDGRRIESLSVTNMLRLLDMYEADTFYARQPLGILEQDNFSDLNGLSGEANFERLKTALKSTHIAFSPKLSATEFAKHVRDLLLPLNGDAPTQASDREETERFLSALANSLSIV